jgi:uncharacterized protein (DUF2461 family)
MEELITTEKDIDLFNIILQNYLQLKEDIANIEDELRIRKQKYNQLAKALICYAKTHNIKHIKLENGSIIEPTLNKSIILNKTTILATLKDYFAENPDEFDTIMLKLKETAITRETDKLNIRTPRTKK